MAGYVLEIDVLGDERIERRLREMGDRAILAEPAMHEIVDVLIESEDALWSRGRSWAPNAPTTQERKGRNDPLVASGALRRSLTEHNAPGQLVEIEHDSLKFGSKLWYAHFALGTSHQPKRDAVRLRPQDRIKIREIILAWLLEGHEGVGLHV